MENRSPKKWLANSRYFFAAMLFAGLVLWVSQKIVLRPQPNSKHRLFGGTTGIQPTVDGISYMGLMVSGVSESEWESAHTGYVAFVRDSGPIKIRIGRGFLTVKDAPPIPVALNEMVLVSYAPERLTVEARLPLVPLPEDRDSEMTLYATSCIRALEAARKK